VVFGRENDPGLICDWSDRAIGGLHYAGGVAHDHIGLDVMPRQSELRWWRHGTRVWGSVVKNGISDHLRQALLSASSGLALRDTEDRGRPGRGSRIGDTAGTKIGVAGRGVTLDRHAAGYTTAARMAQVEWEEQGSAVCKTACIRSC
jgi:hypothetical protein